MKLNRILALILVALLLLSCTVTARAANRDATKPIILKILTYYMTYQEQARTDIDFLLAELEAIDPAQADTWREILHCWYHTYHSMPVCTDVLPDGLPQDDSLCIVVLGFALNGDGSIKPELEGRLEVALRSAQKYPNAYIACSGGANTAHASEAEVMKQWLVSHGIDETRIITENRSTSTTENVQYTYEILLSDYPQICHAAIVTSDYHVRRSCLMWDVMALYTSGYSDGSVIGVVGNAGYLSGNSGDEGLHRQAWGIAIIADIPFSNLPAVPLSRLTDLTVTGQREYAYGEEPAFTAIAHYNSGITRDVSSEVLLSGFTSTQPGEQTVTVEYTENGVTMAQTIQIHVAAPEDPPETDATTLPITEATERTESEPPTTAPISTESSTTATDSGVPVLTIALGIGFGALLIPAAIILRRRK